jgi:tRNA pseudouridine13 synthase
VIPKIDSDIGILVYTTNYSGSGGKIRQKYEDFIVSEVLTQKTLSSISQEDGFAVYKLKKSGIDTNHALEYVFKKFGIRLKALGLKDASAVTEQFVCCMAKGESLENYSNGNIFLHKIGFIQKPFSAKDMIGNHFVIKVTGSKEFSDFTEQEKILNFYGYQRFGSKRAVTHLIGKALVQKRFNDAVTLALSFTSEFDSQENTKIRKIMTSPSKYSEALQILPKGMDLERILLKEMINHSNPQKAFCALPLGIRRLYVDAYQSFLFNLILSKSFEFGEDLKPQQGDVCYDKDAKLGKYEMDPNQNVTIPLVGYSYFKKTRFDYHISKILADEGINPKDFYIKEMQEISNEGGFRAAKLLCTDFAIRNDTVSFTLQRGSFATIVMREIIKPSDPLASGF